MRGPRWILALPVSLAWLCLAAPALAQVPSPASAQVPRGETQFVVADTPSVRFFSGSDAPGPMLKAGEAVTVVTLGKKRARILVRGRYGWVPLSSLSTEPPVVEAPAPGELPPLLPPG